MKSGSCPVRALSPGEDIKCLVQRDKEYKQRMYKCSRSTGEGLLDYVLGSWRGFYREANICGLLWPENKCL